MRLACLFLLTFLGSPLALAQGPDVIVGSLNGINSYGNLGDIYAYSVGTTSCNIGDATLSWIASTNEHPVIGQSLYRLKDGRIEHIGQSWLKHGFAALSGSLCDPCTGPGGSLLSPGCSDPYGAGLNGSQGGLGMKSEVNATTGFFPYPPANPPWSGPVARRVQCHADDVNPAMNGGALYFAEGHYIAADDAAAGNGPNNVSYRPVSFSSDSDFSASLSGSTVRELPAIYAWQEIDPDVVLEVVDVPGDGRFIVGYKVTENPGGGSWHYEYAVHNINSHLCAQALNIPVPDMVSLAGVGFHDVDYHSGEPYSLADWSFDHVGGVASWATDTFATDENANALRWGTLYNFHFDANTAPEPVVATISMFRDTGPASVSVAISAPSNATGISFPTDLTCVELNHDVTLDWVNQDSYDEVRVLRDGAIIATLAGGTETYVDEDLAVGGPYFYQVRGVIGADASAPAICSTFVIGLPSPASLDCTETGGDVTLTWSNPFPYTELTLSRDGLVLATLPGTTTTYTDLGLSNGFYDYSITGTDGINTSAATECTLLVIGGPTSGSVLLYAPTDGTGGDGIEAALIANGMNVITVTSMTGITPAAFDATFIALGIYPNNHALTSSEGTLFADYVEVGGKVYFEGGDTFAFDAGTDLHDVDGITGLSDGSGDLFSIDGVDSGVGMEFTGYLDLEYTGENSWIDHLAPDGASAGVIWTNADNSDDIGIYKSADANGPVIGCSYQFEGLGSVTDQEEVMAIYLAAFGAGSPSEPEFIRGEVNGDGAIDIGDPTYLLNSLFVAGAPETPCDDAADVNDDGGVDIGDAVYALSHQFTSGPVPPSPFPSCGADGTADVLECDEAAACP